MRISKRPVSPTRTSDARPRTVYLGCKAAVDRTAGVLLAALGIKLVAGPLFGK
jgi:hypothetical protein